MPEPLHPPFVSGSLTVPRQLNRWLDINPQGGPLTRTQAFITLPAFSVDVTWNGLSDIVAAFNFEGPNNFSLKSFNALATTPNYVLCVSWRDNNGNINRYKLWSGVGEVMPFTAPLYTGQLIKKNFRFEVWSTNSTPTVQATALTFYTSVLGVVDYRFGSDFTLVSNDGAVTNFGAPLFSIASPSHYFSALKVNSHFNGTGTVVDSMVDIIAGIKLSDASVAGHNVFLSTTQLNGIPVLFFDLNTSLAVTGLNETAPNEIWMVFTVGGSNNTYELNMGGGNTIKGDVGSLHTQAYDTVRGGGISLSSTSGTWCIARLTYGNLLPLTFDLYDLLTGVILQSGQIGAGLPNPGNITQITLNDLVNTPNGCFFYVFALLTYSTNLTNQQAANIVNYFKSIATTSGNLPLTFPANSYSQPN